MLNDIKSMISLICVAIAIVFAVVSYGLFISNGNLKKKIAEQELIISDQGKYINLYQDKEINSLNEIEKRDKEITELRKKRQENDKKHSKHYQDWSIIVLPDDVSKFMH